MANWLGQNGYSKDAYNSLHESYGGMYPEQKPVYEEVDVIIDSYRVTPENIAAIMEGKKKCKKGYKLEDGKCVKKEKRVVVVRGGYGVHHHHHHHDDDKDDDKGTEKPTSTSDSGGGDGGAVAEEYYAWLHKLGEAYDISDLSDQELFSIYVNEETRNSVFSN